MFVVDTNVVSELRKAKSGKANRNVTTWAASVPTSSMFVSVVTILEIEIGVRLLERRDSKQGAVMRAWMDDHVVVAFTDRVLDIDAAVAIECAKLHVPDPRSERDALIAATALVHGLTIATRNVADFASMGVSLLDPWSNPSPATPAR
jgi:predicted nucleic acid-binding protein